MQLNMDGYLGGIDSALEVKFRADDLLEWDDFIAAIRGPENARTRIGGKALWNGRVLGPLVGPTFAGHVHSTDTQYDKLSWQEIDGDMEYSPDGFQLARATARHGDTTADLDLSLKFDRLEFPSGKSLDARGEPAPRFERRHPDHVRHFLSRERILHRLSSRRRHTRIARGGFEFQLRGHYCRGNEIRPPHPRSFTLRLARFACPEPTCTRAPGVVAG